MASRIEAVIYDGASCPAALPPGASTVPLRAGLTMVPVTGELAPRLGQSAAGEAPIMPGWVLRERVATLNNGSSALVNSTGNLLVFGREEP